MVGTRLMSSHARWGASRQSVMDFQLSRNTLSSWRRIWLGGHLLKLLIALHRRCIQVIIWLPEEGAVHFVRGGKA